MEDFNDQHTTNSGANNSWIMYQEIHGIGPPASFKVLSTKDQYLYLQKELQPLLTKINSVQPCTIKSRKELREHVDRLEELRMLDILIGIIVKYPTIPHNLDELVDYEYDIKYLPPHLAKLAPEVKPVFCGEACAHPKNEKDTKNEKPKSSSHLNDGNSKGKCRDKKCEKCKCTPNINYKKFCITCNNLKEDKLLLCGHCKQVAYCNIECQKKNWNIHKRYCNAHLNKEGREEEKKDIFATTLFFTLYDKPEAKKVIGALNGILNRYIPLLPGQNKNEEEMRYLLVSDYGDEVILSIRSTPVNPYLEIAKSQGVVVQSLPYIEYIRKIEGTAQEIIATSGVELFIPFPECKNRGEYRKWLYGYLNSQHDYQHLYNGEASIRIRI